MMRSSIVWMILLFVLLICGAVRNERIAGRLQQELCLLILRQYVPNLMEGCEEEEDQAGWLSRFLADSGQNVYGGDAAGYELRTESDLLYEQVLAENVEENVLQENAAQSLLAAQQGELTADASKKQTISLKKLNDFDYLIQHFYTVDKTTTIKSSELKASELLAKDCTIQKKSTQPQILIYHTHASEEYKGSLGGNIPSTVVSVGDRLAQILTEKYGYTVCHDTGVYDRNRNRAYTVAEPYITKILEENPSIEVVIDLHRDGVGSSTRLVTEQNGKKMAQIMFFNGLSRTTAVGNIDYLYNPYIQDNLAFSLQMQVASAQKYPGFARKIYLKGYRYNMHFRPKSLLIEVGAQTNTIQEAMNAMEPLADVLNEVLSGGSEE